MPAPEVPAAPEQLSHEERLLEVAQDQGIINGFMAEAGATGTWPDNSAPKRPKRHYSHRGGRAYNEDSGQEESRRIANAEREAAEARGETSTPPTKAYLAARAMLEQANDAKKAEGDISLQLALSRARAERRKRS